MAIFQVLLQKQIGSHSGQAGLWKVWSNGRFHDNLAEHIHWIFGALLGQSSLGCTAVAIETGSWPMSSGQGLLLFGRRR